MSNAIYPVNVYGTVNAPWVYALRKNVEEQLVGVDFNLNRITKRLGLNDGQCYIFKGGVEVSPVYELADIEIPRSRRLHLEGFISSFVFDGQRSPVKDFTFIPGKLVCDSTPDYDILSVKAHEGFMETGEFLSLNRAIRKYFPEFCLDWIDHFPRVEIAAVPRGRGYWYVDALKDSVMWKACNLTHLYLEMGKDTVAKSIKDGESNWALISKP